jgi:sarcosine oxidase, subunit beta
LTTNFDFIVAGAGIFGASVAYQLKKLGAGRVLLIERGAAPAAGTTAASAAIIRQHYSNEILSQVTRESIGILQGLERERGKTGLFHAAGWHFLIPEDSLEGARENVNMQRRAGINTSLRLMDEIRDELPWLNPDGVAAVVYEPDSGYADPVSCSEALVAQFERLGGTTMFGTACDGLIRNGDRIDGVMTKSGTFSAKYTVNACGPWSSALAATARVSLPIRIYREQETVWQCKHAEDMPKGSISNGVDAIYLRPMGEGRYTIGRGFPKEYEDANPDAYDKRADDEVVQDILTRAQLRFPPFAHAVCLNGFASLYDVTPDWYPFIGKRSDVSGYADASGGSGHGFKLAPALGARLADWLLNGKVSPEIERLSHDRVITNRLFSQKFGGNRG